MPSCLEPIFSSSHMVKNSSLSRMNLSMRAVFSFWLTPFFAPPLPIVGVAGAVCFARGTASTQLRVSVSVRTKYE